MSLVDWGEKVFEMKNIRYNGYEKKVIKFKNYSLSKNKSSPSSKIKER